MALQIGERQISTRLIYVTQVAIEMLCTVYVMAVSFQEQSRNLQSCQEKGMLYRCIQRALALKQLSTPSLESLPSQH